MSTDKSGTITKEWAYIIDCGLCRDTDMVSPMGTKCMAADEARSFGWSMTQAHGWICPKCVRKLDV